MESQIIITALVLLFVYWRFRASRKKIIDKEIQSSMLSYLEKHESFTVDEYIEAHHLKSNFFVQSKVLAAASDLVTKKVIDFDKSGGEVFNKPKGVRFFKKKST